MEWLGDIAWADKLVPDLIVFLFSLIGFASLPTHLGRILWFIVFWFVGLNVLLFLGGSAWTQEDASLAWLHWENTWFFAALGQLPWLLFVLDLLFGGRLSGPVAAIPLRELLLWNVTRIMGLHYLLAIHGGYAPQEFAVEAGFSEILTGLVAALLWLVHFPDRGWYRTLLIFWNTYGLTSAMMTAWRVLFSNPEMPGPTYSREIFQYMTGYPQGWVYAFWLPIAIGMHAAVFYKMYVDRNPSASRPAIAGG